MQCVPPHTRYTHYAYRGSSPVTRYLEDVVLKRCQTISPSTVQCIRCNVQLAVLRDMMLVLTLCYVLTLYLVLGAGTSERDAHLVSVTCTCRSLVANMQYLQYVRVAGVPYAQLALSNVSSSCMLGVVMDKMLVGMMWYDVVRRVSPLCAVGGNVYL